MTVKEMIETLQKYSPTSEVEILVEMDECDTCARLTKETCSLQGKCRLSCIDFHYRADILTIEAY